MTVGYDGHRKGSYEVVGMGGFNQHTAKTNSHRSKDNVQLLSSNTFAPVSLYYNIPFSKNNGLASALQ